MSANRSGRVERTDIEDMLNEERSHPVLNFDDRKGSGSESGEDDRIVIFHLNGVDYSIPKNPRIGLGLRFANDRRTYGADVAVMNLLKSMLGDEGFEALISYEDLTASDLETVTEICSRTAMGKLETPKAK